MPKSIVNQPTPSQVSGRLATWHRVMEEAGLDYADLQTPIDEPDFRVRLVEFWRSRGKPAAVQLEPAPQTEPQFPPVPAVGELFELEIDGDLDITPSGWKALGPDFPTGKRVYRAKLLDLGSQPNLAAARKAAKVKEPNFQMAPGAAREAFMAKFPRHNGRPVMMGGQEWRGPDRRRLVAYLFDWGGEQWNPSFYWSGNDFGGRWLWLVVEQVS